MDGEGAVVRIAIATAGRFHVLDLARELSSMGHEVSFYSYVPRGRAISFGLPERCHVNLFPWLAPLLLLERLGNRRFRRKISEWIRQALDWLVCLRLKPCDVFIGMSGIYLRAPAKARSKWRARVLVERGSRHIQSQREILAAINGAEVPSDWDVRRELACYELADLVVIPSQHVLESFQQRAHPVERLFVNPYGVDTRIFKPVPRSGDSPRTVIFVGTWCLRKGAD